MFSVGDLVFAKVKGHPEWPAIVKKENKSTFSVLFFATNEENDVKKALIYEFNEKNEDKFSKKYSKRDLFLEAMDQMRKFRDARNGTAVSGTKLEEDFSIENLNGSAPVENQLGVEVRVQDVWVKNVWKPKEIAEASIVAQVPETNVRNLAVPPPYQEQVQAEDEIMEQQLTENDLINESQPNGRNSYSAMVDEMPGLEVEDLAVKAMDILKPEEIAESPSVVDPVSKTNLWKPDVPLPAKTQVPAEEGNMEKQNDSCKSMEDLRKNTAVRDSQGKSGHDTSTDENIEDTDPSNDNEDKEVSVLSSIQHSTPKLKENNQKDDKAKTENSFNMDIAPSTSSNLEPFFGEDIKFKSSSSKWSSKDSIGMVASASQKKKLGINKMKKSGQKYDKFKQKQSGGKKITTCLDEGESSQFSICKQNKIDAIMSKFGKTETDENKENLNKGKKTLKRKVSSTEIEIEDFNSMMKETQGEAQKKKKITKKKPKEEKKTKEENSVKKPDNMWIMFFKDNQQEIKEKYPGINHKEISTVLSNKWQTLKSQNSEIVKQYTEKYAENYRKYEEFKATRGAKENEHEDSQGANVLALKEELAQTQQNLETVMTENEELKKENNELKKEIKNVKKENDEKLQQSKNQSVAFLQYKTMLQKKIEECDALRAQLKAENQ